MPNLIDGRAIAQRVYADLRRSETIFHCDSCDRILFLRDV